MNTNVFKNMIAVIKSEKNNRELQLQNMDFDDTNQIWLLHDRPFLNELCLMLLVTLRHEVEKELIRFAARAFQTKEEISSTEYKEKIDSLKVSNKKNWKRIQKTLELCENDENGTYPQVDALRLLSNSYKHNPFETPSKELLNHLKLDLKVNYASLPESDAFRKGLAEFIKLEENAEYWEIAERYIDICKNFLTDVEKKNKLSKINWKKSNLFDLAK